MIDIIIPVYNAPEYLKDCIDSVCRHTDPSDARIVIIDDQSPDPEIQTYLKKVKKLWPAHTFIIKYNEVNLGFVGTVNAGMQLSGNDVILLNSDTAVTAGWLRKLRKAAYSGTIVGTVTPLTNNGTICSVPDFLQDNVLPEGYTIDTFGEFIENVSFKLYPELPTAVGFCMYIKREALNAAGYFDEINFGKGYGEENDFCVRLIKLGYTNILADDTYVYHKGSMSFTGEKADLLKKNSQRLAEIHPEYFPSVEEFVRRNPLSVIHQNILLKLGPNAKNRPNVLFLLHRHLDSARPGGTEFHVKDLIENLPDQNSWVITASGNQLIIKRYLNNKWYTITLRIHEWCRAPSDSNYSYRRIIRNLLAELQISSVHIHHVMNQTYDAAEAARELGIPLIISVHDFFFICPRVNMVNYSGNVCDATVSAAECSECLGIYGAPFQNAALWRARWGRILQEAECVIFPSASAESVVKSFYQSVKSRVISHGLPENKHLKIAHEVYSGHRKLNAAFVGFILKHKGSELILKIISDLKNQGIIFHFFGEFEYYNDIKHRVGKDIFFHGLYERGDLPGLLTENRIDVVLNLSVWHETYSYTLSEVLQAGIPVISTDLGAVKERILEYNCGFIAEKPYAENVVTLLKKIRDNPEILKEKSGQIKLIHIKTLAEMVAEYKALYRSFSPKKSSVKFSEHDWLFPAFDTAGQIGYPAGHLSKQVIREILITLIDKLRRRPFFYSRAAAGIIYRFILRKIRSS